MLRISSDGDDRWNLFGFAIFDSGIFWVGKCGKYFFVYFVTEGFSTLKRFETNLRLNGNSVLDSR